MAATSPVVKTIELDEDAIKAREKEVQKETEEEIRQRLAARFDILRDMTLAVKKGKIRSLIVGGPPGVGKSYIVEEVLNKDDLFHMIKTNGRKNFEIVRGNMSALGLYAKLHEYKDKGKVVVFDDCDDILMDQLSLNILKGALDSGERRKINWNLDSRMLRTEGIPDTFEFEGAAIFITNIKFEFIRSKKLRSHLAALESRSHYIDLQMDTSREKIIRIKDVIKNHGMLDRYNFSEEDQKEVFTFLVSNKAKLRELSLRMALKISDLKYNFPSNWKAMAETTCMIKA